MLEPGPRLMAKKPKSLGIAQPRVGGPLPSESRFDLSLIDCGACSIPREPREQRESALQKVAQRLETSPAGISSSQYGSQDTPAISSAILHLTPQTRTQTRTRPAPCTRQPNVQTRRLGEMSIYRATPFTLSSALLPGRQVSQVDCVPISTPRTTLCPTTPAAGAYHAECNTAEKGTACAPTRSLG